MKFSRSVKLTLAGLATMAMLAGCGDSGNLTAPDGLLDTTPPPAPTNLTFSTSPSGTVVLSWTPSSAPDLASYEVQVSSSNVTDVDYAIAFDPINTDNSFVVAASPVAATDTYRVRAVDRSGNMSAFSAPASITFQPAGDGRGVTPIDIE